MEHEKWAVIPGFKRYQASTHGRLAPAAAEPDGVPQRFLVCTPDDAGRRYQVVIGDDGRRRNKSIAWLVLAAFRGLPRGGKGRVVSLDGSTSNDCLSNLAWGDRVTQAETMRGKLTGTRAPGSGQPGKLVPHAVNRVRGGGRKRQALA